MQNTRIVVFFTFFIAFGKVFATVPPKTLEQMVSGADVIIIGRVASIDFKPRRDNPAYSSNPTPCVYFITIKIEETLKGKIENTDKLIVNSRFLISIYPIFSTRNLSILFLTRKENGTFEVFNGYMGKLDIEESTQMLKYNSMSDQPERESVQSFLNKITNTKP